MLPPRKQCAYLVSAIAAVAGLETASACSLSSDYTPPTVEQKANAAGVVILGKAIKNTIDSFPSSMATKVVEVSQWLKGSGPRYVMVTGFGRDAACRSDVELGQLAIFYGRLDRSSGIISLQYLGAFDAIDSSASAPRVVAAVKSLPSSPSATPIQEGK